MWNKESVGLVLLGRFMISQQRLAEAVRKISLISAMAIVINVLPRHTSIMGRVSA